MTNKQAFTDTDLKRLKDCANGYGGHGWPEHTFLSCFTYRRVVIEALIARLEAAEEVAKTVGCTCIDATRLIPHCDCPRCVAYKEWRKAAGK